MGHYFLDTQYLVQRAWQEINLNTNTVCPGSSDPFHIVSYYINGSLLLGHTVLLEHILK